MATVGAVALAGLTLLVAAALLQVGWVIAAKHQAQTAADLSALAGSAAALRGDDGCSKAHTVARRNGAILETCRTDLAVVTVRTARTSSFIWGAGFRARADARAAPDFYVPAPGGGSPPASRSRRSSNRTAPSLSRGSLPLPHFGD